MVSVSNSYLSINSFNFIFYFVKQVDHEKRDGLEHKIERELVTGALKDVVVLDNDTTVNPVLFQNELRSRVTSSNLNDTNI